MLRYKEAGNGYFIKIFLDENGDKIDQTPSFNKGKPGNTSAGYYAEMQAWQEKGGVIEPQYTTEELAENEINKANQAKENLIKSLTGSVQSHLDSEAQKLGYDSIFTAVTYAEESAVEKFKTEGLALRAWRSLVWEKCYQILADVEAGEREQPTKEQIISELPALGL